MLCRKVERDPNLVQVTDRRLALAISGSVIVWTTTLNWTLTLRVNLVFVLEIG